MNNLASMRNVGVVIRVVDIYLIFYIIMPCNLIPFVLLGEVSAITYFS